MNEIGSEFWLSSNDRTSVQPDRPSNTIYLLSGRTAFDYIILDIKATKQFSTISIPSYCCESMIEPFLRNGIAVRFYEVNPSDDGLHLHYCPSDTTDVVFLLDYFGYMDQALSHLAKQAKVTGKIIIYDGTHKLNGNTEVETFADYTICSYRKWFYSNAAILKKNIGNWNISTDLRKRNTQYENLRNKAARLKRDYISGKTVKKDEFLCRFAEAEELLDFDYIGYTAEPESIERLQSVDSSRVAERRRENAQRLLDDLREAALPWLSIPIKTIQLDDCPLFVPVLVEPELRAVVRQKLIEHSIYCPIHWPLSAEHYSCGIERFDQSLYHTELSLVCDQRYDFADMDRIVETLKEIGDTI